MPRRLAGWVRVALTGALVAVGLLVPNSTSADAAICKDVVFVGVRGSGEYSGVGPTIWQVYEEFRDRVAPNRTIHFTELNYASNEFWLAFASINMYLDGAYKGADLLTSHISDYVNKCKSDIVLAGYSQGALVIRLAMPYLKAIDHRLAGVALIADPARVGSGDGFQHYGDARSDLNGVYTIGLGRLEPFSGWARGRMVSYCRSWDPVCAMQYPFWEPNHRQYKSNGMARTAGQQLADGVVRLPRPYPAAAPQSAPPAPAPPPPTPRYPDGNFVSTCNLGGASRCTGANLRSIPIRPGNVTHTVAELTQVQPLCGTTGSRVSDAYGKVSDRWWWVRAATGHEGYVSELYLFGPGFSTPSCDPLINGGGDSTYRGSYRHGGTLTFKYPLRSDGYFGATLVNPRLQVRGPNQENLDVRCQGPETVRLAFNQRWDCEAPVHLPLRGRYSVTLVWQTPEGRLTDGTPDWPGPWRWLVDTHPPTTGLDSQLKGDGAYAHNSHTIESTIQNEANNAITIAPRHQFDPPPTGPIDLACMDTPATISLAPGERFTCRSRLPFDRKGDYTIKFAYDFGGASYTPNSPWGVSIPENILKPALTLVDYAINTPDPVYAASPLEAEFTIKSTGLVAAKFYPQVFSDPLLYGGWGQCQGIDYSGDNNYAGALVLDPGQSYRCVTSEVLTAEARGPFVLTAGALLLNTEGNNQDDPGYVSVVKFPMATVHVKPRPVPPPPRKPPATPTLAPREQIRRLTPPRRTVTIARVSRAKRPILRLHISPDPARNPGRWTFLLRAKKQGHGRWRTIARSRTDSSGNRRLSLPRKGSREYRVVTPAQSSFATSSSRVLTIVRGPR